MAANNDETNQGYTHLPAYLMQRTVLRQEDFVEKSGYQQSSENYVDSVRQSCEKISILQIILNLVPVLKWLPKYSIKANLACDIAAGATVAVMHIPQGMAYGLLAGVGPNSGLYMAFFPTLIYFVFGTSRHISVGTLSVISLMTLNMVHTYAKLDNLTPLHNTTTTTTTHTENNFTALQVVTATAIMCGVHQIIMSLLRLGNLSTLLSESLINGFTTGTAVHVTVSQLKDLFGLQIPRYDGAFKIIYTVIDCVCQLKNSNWITVIVSTSVILFMVFMNQIVKPSFSKFCKFPVPAELMAVVGGTLLSQFLELGKLYNVRLIGHIPMGLPEPQLPPFRLLRLVAVDSIAIAVVSYTVTISMAMIFAKKQNYEVKANQELLALGLSNIVGGTFSCIPNATSLSRSLIQEQTGGKTQVASVFSAFLILIILLWIAPFFQVLPRCVLAGIIVVALKGMYMQANDLKRLHRESIFASFTWIVTFFTVVLIDVDIGLFFGICCSLLTIYVKGWRSQYAILGSIDGTGIYGNIKVHKNAVQLPNVHIFQYIGAINFSSAHSFKRKLYKNILPFRSNAFELNGKDDDSITKLQPNAVIIDFSCVSNIDISACKTFADIQIELQSSNTVMYLCAPNDRIYETIKYAEVLSIGKFSIFPSIHDAVLYFKTASTA